MLTSVDEFVFTEANHCTGPGKSTTPRIVIGGFLLTLSVSVLKIAPTVAPKALGSKPNFPSFSDSRSIA